MGAESSMTVEGRKVPSTDVEKVLRQLSDGKQALSLLDLAEIRGAGKLDQNGDGQRDRTDFYSEGGKVREVWTSGKVRVKWQEFLNCSLYIDRLLSTPAQAMIVKRTDFSDRDELRGFFIGFAKDFHDARDLKTLDIPKAQGQKPAEEASRYIIRTTFFKEGSAVLLELIDRNVEVNTIYPLRSFVVSADELGELGLNFDLQEGAKLEDSLKQYLWQIVTKEGPFKQTVK